MWAREALISLSYSCFSEPAAIREGEIIKFSPKAGDPADYVAISSNEKPSFAITVTCAANALDLVPKGDWAQGNKEAAQQALSALGRHLKLSAKEAASRIMDKACDKFIPILESLIKEYKLDRENVVLVGGGGGACAVVPYLANRMKFSYRIAKNNAVISAIGVALALIHESIERSVIAPTDADVVKIRKEAEQKVMLMGAVPGTISVQVEVDARRNLLKASAFGASEMRKTERTKQIGDEEALELCAKSMRIGPQSVKLLGKTSFLSVFGARSVSRKYFGLLKEIRDPVRVINRSGVIRLRRPNASVIESKAVSAVSDLTKLLDEQARYGDAGESVPQIFLLFGAKIVDLSGLTERSQITGLASLELDGMLENEPVLVISVKE